MKYQRPKILVQGDTVTQIQAGMKNWPLLFDLILVASTSAYEADE